MGFPHCPPCKDSVGFGQHTVFRRILHCLKAKRDSAAPGIRVAPYPRAPMIMIFRSTFLLASMDGPCGDKKSHTLSTGKGTTIAGGQEQLSAPAAPPAPPSTTGCELSCARSSAGSRTPCASPAHITTWDCSPVPQHAWTCCHVKACREKPPSPSVCF